MKTDNRYVLAVNGGSSSIKVAVFDVIKNFESVFTGKLHNIGSPSARLDIVGKSKPYNFSKIVDAKTYENAITLIIEWLMGCIDTTDLLAIGHRMVHGGAKYHRAGQITPGMLKELEALVSLDPDHLPGAMILVEVCAKHFPDIYQVASFDTAFHHDMPFVAQLLPIPRRYTDKGMRRYGFHGLSCTYLMEKLNRLNKNSGQGKVILAHLGSGASITAVYNGKSIDTSMGLTPCSGLPMSKRTGDLDPGLIFYLAHTERISVTELNDMVNHESGLLGVSELSGDISVLLQHMAHNEKADDAVRLFCYHAKKTICAMAGALQGLDSLVFAGGIGENIPEIRARICEGLAFIGITIDPNLNRANADIISSIDSRVSVRIINTDEEVVIAREAYEVFKASNMQPP